MTVTASLLLHFITEELFAINHGNADVLVGWVTDNGARIRKRADEDVGVPMIEVAMCWHIHVRIPIAILIGIAIEIKPDRDRGCDTDTDRNSAIDMLQNVLP